MSQFDERFGPSQMSDDAYAPHGDYHGQGGGETNGLGIAGFVLSILSLLTLGLLSPLSLLLSLIAVFRRPRGFAIAGLIITFVSLIPVFLIMMLTAALIAAGPVIIEDGSVLLADVIIQTKTREDRAMLTAEQGNAFVQKALPLATIQYRLLDDETYELRAPGPDKKFDTPDDFYVRGFAPAVAVEDEAAEEDEPEEETEDVPMKKPDGRAALDEA